jgi:RNA-directed DNA polymerase
VSEAKPFAISKWEVLEAYKRVKANQGAAGVDEQSIADFERNLKRNLYKIWNRMSSGSYFPPPRSAEKLAVPPPTTSKDQSPRIHTDLPIPLMANSH